MTKFEKFLSELKPVAFLIRKSKTTVLPGFYGLCLYDVVTFVISQINRIGIRDRASAIAFNFIMAIPAAAIFLFTLIPYFPVAQNMQDELFRFIADVMPNSESRALIMTTMLDLFNKPKRGLLSIGFILALFYSSNAMLGIIRTFDSSLLVRSPKKFMQRRLRAMRLTIVLILLVIATILLSIGQGALFASFLNRLGVSGKEKNFWTELLRWLLVIFLFFFSVAYTYKYAPSVQKRWRLWSPGAVFATLLIVLATWVFSIWAQNFSSYNRIYGSIGALLITMLLIFINSLMLLIGYELNVSINYLRQKAEEKNNKLKV
ncbi:YihY/virulence factor BrkB family protein [Parafilimonas sp.]|uniref:YihY/virulence factor BrkB family protein n=1 Tax=Parafilimonas sp. TaxID=1969739 RepID=UPI0039E626D4